MSLQEIYQEVSHLKPEEKLMLLERLWDEYCADDVPNELSDAQKREMLRRSDELRQDPTIGISWKELRSRAFREE